VRGGRAARGDIGGGGFVAGFGGQLSAAPDAVGRLRSVRKREPLGELAVVSAADPLNLVGILTPHPRVAAIYRNRILLHDGLPVAALEGGEVRRLGDSPLDDARLKMLLVRRSLRHPIDPHLRSPTPREAALLARKQQPSALERLSERRH
jgi:ATP-dependent Lhr-like helicase